MTWSFNADTGLLRQDTDAGSLSMTFDLGFVCRNLGVKERYRDPDGKVYTQTAMTVPHAKRIMKYFFDNCDDQGVIEAVRLFVAANNSKLLEIYDAYLKRYENGWK